MSLGTYDLVLKLSIVLVSRLASPLIDIVIASSPITLIGCSEYTLTNTGNSINVFLLLS